MDYDVVIIGAGVVGLAIAEIFSRENLQCLVIEQHKSFGYETSSRNSEVIHAGIYYCHDCLKTKLCVEGNRLLYEFCLQHEIQHKKIGKLIIANEIQDIEKLHRIYKNGLNNNVEGLRLLTKKQINDIEPNIIAEEGFFSENSGIIDSHSLMSKLEFLAKSYGCDFAYHHKVESFYKNSAGWIVNVYDNENSKFNISTRFIINAAGLESDELMQKLGIDLTKEKLKLNFCKGHYFKLISSKKNLVNHLVYPIVNHNYGLGIHLTKDLSGDIKFGPDTLFLDTNEKNYNIDENLKEKFHKAVIRYIRNVGIDDISADYCGIRPKLQDRNEDFRDFYICEESNRNLQGLVNLIGIESPGLTSCLSIANYVFNMIKN